MTELVFTGLLLSLVWLGVIGLLIHWAMSDIPSQNEKNRKRAISLFLVVIGIAIVNLLVNYQ